MAVGQWHSLNGLRKKYLLSSRAKRGICFSSRLPRNSRFLGQTPPFGMTWRALFRSLFSLSRVDFLEGLKKSKENRLRACSTFVSLHLFPASLVPARVAR